MVNNSNTANKNSNRVFPFYPSSLSSSNPEVINLLDLKHVIQVYIINMYLLFLHNGNILYTDSFKNISWRPFHVNIY